MTAFRPLVPSKAIEIIEAAGIQGAHCLLRDHAAAGLVRSYAMVIETTAVGHPAVRVRGSTISADLWRRIIREGVDHNIWTGGTVRLVGCTMIGGTPVVEITGIGFNGEDLARLIDQYCDGPDKPKRRTRASSPGMAVARKDTLPEREPRRRRTPDLSTLNSGALLLTVDQTKAALAIGHTSFYKLLNAGKLERAPFEGGTRVTTASVRRLAGC